MGDAMSDDELQVDLVPLHEGGGQVAGPKRYLIRITHIPTGMSVTASDNRGQHKGRDYALTFLKMMVEDLG